LDHRIVSSTEDFRNIFGRIYKLDSWSNGSGPGSRTKNVIEYRSFLERFIVENDIKTVTDFGCGDWQFSRFIDWSGISYTGIDVVSEVIERNASFTAANVSFEVFEALTDLPGGDLLIAKEVLQHLPNSIVNDYLDAFCSSYKFVLVVNGAEPLSQVNLDINPGEYRPLRLEKPPFNRQCACVHVYYPSSANHIWKNRIYLFQNQNSFNQRSVYHMAKPVIEFNELAFHHRLNRPGTIIEIGANKGEMTLHFSVWENNKVVALEPVPHIFQTLKKRLEEGFRGALPERVTLLQAAAGERISEASIRVPKIDSVEIDEWASLAKSFKNMPGVEFDEFKVNVVSIDSLGVYDVSNIKIDAEGFEGPVLRGARETIKRCRPVLSVECEERHAEGTTSYVPGFMKALGYNCFWFDAKETRFRTIDEFDRHVMQVAGSSPVDRSYSDPYIFIFYFVPEENYDYHVRLSAFGGVPLLA
jgi:FkbM family methyltransferase